MLPSLLMICVAGWGYLLYSGVTDPMGGIYTLWPLFGASNQMLAGIALLLATVVLFKMGKQKYTFVTIAPAIWVLITTLYAAILKLMPANGERVHDAVSHVAIAQNTAAKLASLSDPAAIEKAQAIIRNNVIDAVLCALFVVVTIIVIAQTIRMCLKISKGGASEGYFKLAESEYVDRGVYEKV